MDTEYKKRFVVSSMTTPDALNHSVFAVSGKDGAKGKPRPKLADFKREHREIGKSGRATVCMTSFLKV